MATDDNHRQSTLRSLIAHGKSQGYLIRAEAIAMLPAELFTEEMRNDILETIREMGIPVVYERPTAAELAAMQAPPESENPKSVVSPPPVDQTIGAPIVVLHVGAEGGEIRLIAQELTTGWRYRYTTLDQTDLWLEEGGTEIHRQSAWVYEWNDVLAALDRYPWAELPPQMVHPQFADRVLVAANERLAKAASALRSERRLAAWSALCRTSLGAAVR